MQAERIEIASAQKESFGNRPSETRGIKTEGFVLGGVFVSPARSQPDILKTILKTIRERIEKHQS